MIYHITTLRQSFIAVKISFSPRNKNAVPIIAIGMPNISLIDEICMRTYMSLKREKPIIVVIVKKIPKPKRMYPIHVKKFILFHFFY